jgi:hypothetical protein
VGKKRDRKLARAIAAVEVDAAARGLKVSGSVLDIIADIRARYAARSRKPEPEPETKPERRGAPPDHDWKDAEDFAVQELNERGDPTNPAYWTDGWKNKTSLDRAVLNYMIEKHGTEPDIKTVGRHTVQWLAAWREERKGRN